MTKLDYDLEHLGPALDLVRAVLQAGPGWSWLVDRVGTVLVGNDAGRELAGADGTLPVLSGPQISIDLAGLVRSIGPNNQPIEMVDLELEGIFQEKDHLAWIRVVPLDLPEEWPKLVLVNLNGAPASDDLALQGAETDRLQSLTGLAAKIVHELNNPLDGSMRYINLALRRLQHNGAVLQSPDKVTEYLSSAREALGKITDILSDLVKFARHGQSDLETISVNDLVEQAVRTLSARANTAGVSIVTLLSDNLPRAGGTRLYQVFCNLLKNAIDAVEERRRHEPDAPARVTITTRLEDGAVQIVFEDTGVGLPENRQFLFDPFFTTKPTGQGTGLGLAISREIVHACGGKISAQDNPKGGARFLVELSVLDPAETGRTVS